MATRAGALVLVAALLSVSAVHGQVWSDFWRGWRGEPPRYATPALRDGDFHFCRLQYTSYRREAGGSGWRTDYPGADINLSIRLSELTRTSVSLDGEGGPEHFVVRADGDDSLFRCPFVILSDGGTLRFEEAEVVRLREYLLKGGFLWSDDFWGPRAWASWEHEISRVLPPSEFPIRDIPPTHQAFQMLFNVKEILQVPAISQWRRSGGETSERGPDSATVNTRGIFDERGRLMVLMTHNTDISDTWEREGEDIDYFHRFSPEGYAIAVNVLLYTMVH